MDEPSLRKTQWYSLAIVIFAGDQAAKSYIDATTPLGWSHEVASFFNLVHALNPGAAFSFLAGAGGWQRWFFLAIAFAISAWLAWLLSRPLRKTEGLSYNRTVETRLGLASDGLFGGEFADLLQHHYMAAEHVTGRRLQRQRGWLDTRIVTIVFGLARFCHRAFDGEV